MSKLTTSMTTHSPEVLCKYFIVPATGIREIAGVLPFRVKLGCIAGVSEKAEKMVSPYAVNIRFLYGCVAAMLRYWVYSSRKTGSV